MRARSLCLLAGALALGGCAAVGTPAAPRPDPDLVVMAGSGTGAAAARAGVAAMTYEELLSCAQQVNKLGEDRRRLDQQSTQIEARRTRLNRLGDSLDAARPALDTRDTKKVDAFNLRIASHRSATTSLNSSIDVYNASLESQKQLSNSFNAACANRSYRRSHYATLPLDLRTAIERNSTDSEVPIRTP